MSLPGPGSANTSDEAPIPSPPIPEFRCLKCCDILTQADKQMAKDKYWKNCKKCRHMKKVSQRRLKAAVSSHSCGMVVQRQLNKAISTHTPSKGGIPTKVFWRGIGLLSELSFDVLLRRIPAIKSSVKPNHTLPAQFLQTKISSHLRKKSD